MLEEEIVKKLYSDNGRILYGRSSGRKNFECSGGIVCV